MAATTETNEPLPGTSGTSCIAKDEDSTEQDLCGFVDLNGHAYFIDAISRDKFTDREGNEFEFDESENGYHLLKEDGRKGEHFDFDDQHLTLCDTESTILRKSRFLVETMNKRKSSAALEPTDFDKSQQVMQREMICCAFTKPYKPKSAKKCLQNEPKHGEDDNFPPFDGKFMVEIEKRREAATKVLQNRIGEIIESTPFNFDEPARAPRRRGKPAF